MGREGTAELRRVRDSISGEREWEFPCECGRRNCSELVFFTVDEYAALHDDRGLVLAEGHRVSRVARARQLLAAARALSANRRAR